MNWQSFFSEEGKMWQVATYTIIFLICWNLEPFFGVTKEYNKWKHIRTNALFILPGLFLQTVMGIIFIKVLLYENTHKLGLLNYFNVTSGLWQFIISFIVWDFIYWVYHFVMHKFKLVWRFHAVHHSDQILDVGTSLREHPIETIIRLTHYMLAVWLLAPVLWIVSLHQFVQVVSKIIIHSNFRLPEKIDKYLSYLIITPNMHHVHHHHEQPYTDSNYGDLFSVWDRMFGTYTHLLAEDTVFGLDVEAFDNPESKNLRFKGLISIPFSKNNLSND